MNEKKKEFEVELLTSKQLAVKLGCKEARIRYLNSKGKLGYLSTLRKDGRRIYVYDRPFKVIESVKQRIDFADIVRDINYLLLSLQQLRRRVLILNKQFVHKEKALLDHRLKV